MTTETFLEKLDQLVVGCADIGKLRELILDLAISGKLVQADCLHPERAGWATIPLGDIASLITKGATPTSYGFQYQTDGVPFVKVENLENGFIQRASITEFIAEDTHQFLGRSRLQAGDILFSIAGTIGKTGIVAEADVPANTNQALAIIRGVDTSFDIRFLKIQLDSFVSKAIKRRARGGAMPNVSLGDLRALPVVVPPLTEQKRIVANVDELMALCDRLDAQLQERDARQSALACAALARFAEVATPANLEFLFHDSFTIDPADLRKTILSLAVQGKLVPQDPNDQPVGRCFPGLRPVAAELSSCTEKPPQWEVCSYRSLTSLVTSGSRGWKEFYAKSGAVFIRTQNIKTDRLILDDVVFVQLPDSAEGMRTRVLKDDIMITITGANVTKAARVEEEIVQGYVSQHIALTRPRWPEMSKWLHLCFISPGAARGQLEQLAYGDKPGLNLNNIRDLLLPVPPLAEQCRIVAKVEELMALVDQLEVRQAAARETGAKLLDALIADLLQSTSQSSENQEVTANGASDEKLERPVSSDESPDTSLPGFSDTSAYS